MYDKAKTLSKLENSYLKNIFKKYFQKCSFSTSLIYPEMLVRRKWLYKHGNHIPLVLKRFSKPIWTHQFKAFLPNPNQWKCNVLRSLFCLESPEKGLTQNQTMHNLAEGKFPRQLCKHGDSPGPWLTSVAAFSKRGKGRGEKGGEKGRRVLEAHTQRNVPLHDYHVHARPQRYSASEHLVPPSPKNHPCKARD